MDEKPKSDRPSYEPLVLHREPRFYVSLLANQRPRVVMTGPWDPSVADYMEEHELTDVSFNSGMGWVGGGIEFLAHVRPLRSIALLDWKTHDLTPLVHHAATLQELVLECNPKRLPSLSDLPALTRISMTWEKGWGSFFDRKPHGLLSLAVQNWPYEDLSILDELAALETFVVIRSRRLRDVGALRDRERLRKLDLTQCHGVEDFSPLGTCVGLIELELNCVANRDIVLVSRLERLERLCLGKQDIPTLAPLETCRKLRRFSIEGRVLDADLSIFLRLPAFEWAAMRNRREYRPSVKEINAACGHRGQL
jgi:hypothetical protein